MDKYCPQCGEVNWCACAKLYAESQEIYRERIKNQVSIDYTESGPQYMIPDAPTRKVPTTPLKPKRPQTEKPTLLEMYEEEIKQPKLF